MCIGGGSKGGSATQQLRQVTTPAATTPTPSKPPNMQTPQVTDAGTAEKKRLRALKGNASTIATSGLGLTAPANVGGKMLLGQ